MLVEANVAGNPKQRWGVVYRCQLRGFSTTCSPTCSLQPTQTQVTSLEAIGHCSHKKRLSQMRHDFPRSLKRELELSSRFCFFLNRRVQGRPTPWGRALMSTSLMRSWVSSPAPSTTSSRASRSADRPPRSRDAPCPSLRSTPSFSRYRNYVFLKLVKKTSWLDRTSSN